MATRTTYDLTFSILKKELDEVVTLEEEEFGDGVRAALRLTHNLAEPAGARPSRRPGRWRQQLAGSRIVCVMSGGNIDGATLSPVLSR